MRGFHLAITSGCGSPDTTPTVSTPTNAADPAKAEVLMAVVRDTMAQAHPKAVINRATIDGQVIVPQSRRGSMTCAPAATEMRFRSAQSRFTKCSRCCSGWSTTRN